MTDHYVTINAGDRAVTQTTPEHDLWLNVIKLAIYDYAFPRKTNAKGERKHTGAIQRMAAAWIFGSPDFVKVCHLANIDPEVVRRIARKAATTTLRRQGRPADA